jgi:FkbM family methyltransferase
MTIVYPEYVSSKIGRHGYFETDMTSMFLDVIGPGMVVYDVGSHFGYFSLLASQLVAPSGQVFAFEPTAETFSVLRENAQRRDNIHCHNVAAFRTSGQITFRDQGLCDSSLNFVVNEPGEESCGGPGRLVKIPAVQLDRFAEQHGDPDFVKIDAEGAEGPILEGMSQIIQRARPGIALEMGDGVCQRTGNKPCRENIQFLCDHGYEVFDYRQCRAAPHRAMTRYGYDNLFFRHPQWRYAPQPAAAAA